MHTPLRGPQISSEIGTKYRPDIDGLRAIAVLSVVAFHAFPGVVRSGFVGVDIFFVISGYLITSIILHETIEQRFSFTSFYFRRIKRIFPALIIVLLACLLAGAVLYWPDDFSRLGKHTAASAGFVANLALWQEANYFDVASDSKVLLHLWSLGIEEQFYLIWPALLWLAWRAKLRRVLLFAAIFTASFVYGIKTVGPNPVAAFYSPIGRFWELTAGSVLALVIVTSPPWAVWIERIIAAALRTVFFERDCGIDPDKFYRHVLSTLGMAMILSSIYVITKRNEFPGWAALLPVLGTYLTIAAGPHAWLNRYALSNRLLVWSGLISYPLYLWHWPLLAFARLFFDGEAAPPILRATLIVAAIGLAWLTYHYVEKPIRFGCRQGWIAPALASAVVLIGSIGIITLVGDGLPGRLSADKRDYVTYFGNASPIMQTEHRDVGQDQCNFYNVDSPIPTLVPRDAIDPSCYIRHSDKSLMILGDSNAADLYYGLKATLPKEISILMIYSSGCQVSVVVEHIINTHHCNMANHFALERIKIDPPDVLLLSSNNSYDIDYIRQFATRVKGYGVKHVLVLGMRPHWKFALPRTVLDHFWASTPRYIPGHLDIPAMSLTWKFQSQLREDEPFEFIDEMQAFCNAQGCLAFLGDNRREGLITADTVHLRPHASLWHAREHLAPLIMKHF
ncbi:acyltransferase family protein [Bradyrhizobium zhanjiangense]|uniref:Acyltransferase n=1 Tax=Bradyrhizobium zhanjiangense TaxID=1325107 RepID=A0A4Q0Q956_9BRAD|nr:acyltransferase family protein [Bradyrhizobium zhanjiangense]RXG85767.1 acyltransferase [Bradyrhizobium zhanjiangense]